MAGLISKRYANALFEIAVENKKVKDYYIELKNAVELITTGVIYQIFKSKSINKSRKIDFIKEVLNSTDKEVVDFIKVIIIKHRENLIKDIFEQYESFYKNYYNMIDAKVISAYELSADNKEKIKTNLESSLNKKVNIVSSVDKSILGGLKIIIGNRVIDGSVKARLSSLLKNMEQAM
ncbi:MAG: ATP synthase F1 subunit delta [Thermoanaerobacteraceae bacterium]